MSETLICPFCDSSNEAERTYCFACQRPLSFARNQKQQRMLVPERSVRQSSLPAPSRSSRRQQHMLMSRQSVRQLSPQTSPHITRRSMLVGLGVVAVAVGAGIVVARQVWEEEPGYTYRGHTDEIRGLAWSPDGKRIASASLDKTVQVWDAIDGSNPLIYRKHLQMVNGVGWSPDGKRLASASDDSTIQIWKASNGERIFTCTKSPGDNYETVAWSPDGKRIASSFGPLELNDTALQIWDAADGNRLITYKGNPKGMDGSAWSPDSKRIAFATEKTIQVWDIASGSQLFSYQKHLDNVLAVAWSPDGKRIASGSQDNTVQIWDATNGDTILTYRGHQLVSNGFVNSDIVGYPGYLAWSPDGSHMASVGVTVYIWDATTGQTISTYNGAIGPITWSPDSKRLAFASDENTVQVWDAP